MVLYLDAVWLLNLLIDACLLKLTALMLKRRVYRMRLLFGALMASSVVLILFTPFAILVTHPLGKFLFSVLIIFITFGYGRLSVFLQNLAAFYFSAFAIGGGLFALHYFFQNGTVYADSRFFNTMNFGDPISWIFVVLGFPALWLFSKKRMEQTAVRKWADSTGAEITVMIFNQTIRSRALIDSGNKLYDPLTRLPVMFLSREACGDKVPAALIQMAEMNDPFQVSPDLPGEWESRITWVPYSSVDGTTRYIIAFRPDQVLITHEGRTVECRRTLIALTAQKLSASGDFSSILHPDMLLNGKTIEPAS
ncbi:sigma-E processing peptidase SpoIIGA [Sporolactobacillus shoreae]|uniref:Sporulation sigma-E factor-processing peptidase n=1 Tax=Sporolactobacillus shoreae TaxID=1465501 RepID=A0A4Z0GUG4_9BACL|nr:sigma-E processing peptidase SpoIIGA [Sporolactobacillus shoreae]TGB00207.1 sigma-E processing peptidase SpoIIGA [Sporolactobacillus shoreae]